MLSFHNDQSIKDKYLKRVIKHRELDNIIQGTGWENGKGCAVGCTLENYDHSRYPIELGIPEWLAKLEDIIFENLPKEKAMLWPELFLSSISVGIDLDNIKHKISIKRLNRLIIVKEKLLSENNDLKEIFIETINAIKLIISCHELELNKNYCDWSAAESAARSAAWSAAEAARSATWSARSAAWSAAWSARSAAEAAESAARSAAWSAEAAESATWSARSAAEAARSARSAAWENEANDLIEILKDSKGNK